MHPVRLLIVLASCLTASLAAQTTNTLLTPITLDECIRSAVQQNLRLQIARRAPTIARYDINVAYGVQYDPVFSFEAVREHYDVPADFDPKKPGIDSPYQQTFDTFAAGFMGRATPGLSYNLMGTSSKDSAISDMSLLTPPQPTRYTNDWEADVALQLRQSLLRDFWIDSKRLQIQIAKKDLKISDQAVRFQLMKTVLAVQVAYYDLVYATENVKIRRKALDLARELLADDRQRIALGAMIPLDATLDESLVETAQANLLAAEELLETNRNNLRNLLTDQYAKTQPVKLTPSDSLLVIPEQPDRAEVLRSALTMRPDIIEAKLEAEKRGLVLRYDRNQMFPVLDMIGSLGASAVDTSSRAATFGTLADADHPNYSAGVILKIPLSNMAARNRFHASKEIQEQALLQVQTVEQDVVVQTDNVLAALEKTFQRIDATRQARQYSEKALDAERQKLAVNASTTFLVSEYERNLVAARTAEILSIVDYNKAQAQLSFNQGDILERHQVKLDIK